MVPPELKVGKNLPHYAALATGLRIIVRTNEIKSRPSDHANPAMYTADAAARAIQIFHLTIAR